MELDPMSDLVTVSEEGTLCNLLLCGTDLAELEKVR